MAERLVFFGELLLRLTAPGHELLLQSARFDVHVGGAEANVAVGLARLGRGTAMVSTIPPNALGRGAVAALRSHGVDCAGVQERAGRMGLYFLAAGAGLRASEIVYDRAGSSFASAPASSYDWDRLLAGASLLHLSGINPALGPVTADAALAAARAARRRGTLVSFDGNYRAQLWDSWDSRPRETLQELVAEADLLFGNHRDIGLLLGREFDASTPAARRAAVDAAFAAFPRLGLVASTSRETISADHHRLGARVDRRHGGAEAEPCEITNIVDRIGGGDAFAAGVLHAMLAEGDCETIARTGLALAALKHSLPGDASLFGPADLDALLRGTLDVRR
jgi:2-dehydro-3-deoxygluconokinase